MVIISFGEKTNNVRVDEIGRTKYCVIKMERKFYLQNY